ncbi:MAG: hypothetical protein CW346_13945 [Bacillaceae bacterium]|nr:hypothetical protein [Bacillaceae bacterium]
MNDGSRLKNWVVRAFFASYMYALFKIFVLKFGPTEVEFLWVRLMRNSTNPECLSARPCRQPDPFEGNFQCE